jgi:hypothetical protein
MSEPKHILVADAEGVVRDVLAAMLTTAATASPMWMTAKPRGACSTPPTKSTRSDLAGP